ncbi:MAG: NAD-dependent protein deacylase [Desulfurococcales archaeon]|nr:NAD-dependent protein deacylase [Desulfurococcales archaeon]
MSWRDLVEEAAEILAGSRHAIVLTGAGISTASGIPDFRGKDGLWRKIPSYKFTIEYFMENPMEVWKLYYERFRAMGRVRPNPGHYALTALEKAGVIKAIITQNIDGLHQAAGSKRVIELHGNFRHAVCLSCRRLYPIEKAFEKVENGELPRCQYCGGLLKPNVVLFGEPLPAKAINEAFMLAERSDVILVAGSSLYVSPANQVPVIVKARGGRVIAVNLGEIFMRDIIDLLIEAPTEQALPLLCEKTLEKRGQDPSICREPRNSS